MSVRSHEERERYPRIDPPVDQVLTARGPVDVDDRYVTPRTPSDPEDGVHAPPMDARESCRPLAEGAERGVGSVGLALAGFQRRVERSGLRGAPDEQEKAGRPPGRHGGPTGAAPLNPAVGARVKV